jgi:hypothetical protein
MILAPVGPPAITLAAVSGLIDMQTIRVMLTVLQIVEMCVTSPCAVSLQMIR